MLSMRSRPGTLSQAKDAAMVVSRVETETYVPLVAEDEDELVVIMATIDPTRVSHA